MEHKTANWIANLLQDTPAENEDFDDWIKDGKILCRVINNLMFNAVPTDIVSVTSNDVEVKKYHFVEVINHDHVVNTLAFGISRYLTSCESRSS